MNNFLSHLKLRHQIWLSKLFPAIVLILLLAAGVHTEWSNYQKQDKNNRLYHVTELFNKVIISLQVERSLTSKTFVHSFNSKLLEKHKPKVDKLLLELKALERNPLLRGLFPNTPNRIYFDEELLEKLLEIRAQSLYNINIKTIDEYTFIIRKIIKLFESRAMLSNDTNLSFHIAGLIKLLWVTEYAGAEQILISNALQKDKVDLDLIVRIKEAASLQSKYLNDFLDLSSIDNIQKMLLVSSYDKSIKKITGIRDSIYRTGSVSSESSSKKQPNNSGLKEWFNISSSHIESLQLISEGTIQHIIQYTANQRTSALKYMIAYLVSGLLVLGLSSFISLIITRRFVLGIDHAVNSIRAFQEKGEFRRIHTHNGRDEISRLSTAFNTLIEQQKVSQKDLFLSNKVFALTDDGIIIFNAEKQVILTNKAFDQFSSICILPNSDIDFNTACELDESITINLWYAVDKHGTWRGELTLNSESSHPIVVLAHFIAVLDDSDCVINYIATLTNITDLKSSQHQLEHQAKHDPLTGLPNRRHIDLYLEHEVTRHKNRSLNMGILFLDLNDFKYVNDTLGHEIGDEVLIVTARRIKNKLKNNDVVARQGGDEFLVILSETDNSDAVAHIAESLIRTIKQPINIDGKEVRVGVSIGISVFPQDSDSFAKLIAHADMAMYQAKKEPSSAFSFFTPDINKQVSERFQIESDLWSALSNDELYVCYQPKVNMQTGEIIGAEALVRWQHPERGFVPPNEFIPIAEASGLISRIGTFVTLDAIRIIKKMGTQAVPIAVNVAPGQFRTGQIVNRIEEALENSKTPAGLLQIEVTETAFVNEDNKVANLLNGLSDLGIKIAIDDFGTGYSSLSYLQELPIDIVKIDASFIWKLFDDDNSQILVETIINMAKGLKKSLVAEGVETQEQADWLMAHGCDIAQGYFYSKPLAEPDFIEFIASNAKEASQSDAKQAKEHK